MKNRADRIEELCQLLNLSEDAIAIAEGWSILPAGAQRHVQLVIDDYIASEIPLLKKLYSRARGQDQLRFNRIIEAAQDRARGVPPPPEQ